MIRVLVVDDSRLVRTVVREILETDPSIQVVAEAEDGARAVALCVELGPDVVLMDIQMPVMDGLEAVRRIMKERPTPVIILSATVSPGEVSSAFTAVRAGAFEALPKPEGVPGADGYGKIAEDLIDRVKLYARVGRRRGWRTRGEVPTREKIRFPQNSSRVVAVGASTGGPRTVQRFLAALEEDFPCPILLVQHISRGFTEGFAHWLAHDSALDVRVVRGAEPLRAATVYVAAGGHHLEVSRGRVVTREGPPVNACRPSVDVLFESVARGYGPNGIGVVLTGMGRDGARGALAIRRAGGQVIVQDEQTSVIYGMPRAAIELGAATRVVPVERIPAALAESLEAEVEESG